MAEVQRPLQDYPEGLGYIRKGYHKEKEDEQEVRVSDSVRHAQAQGLPRRIIIIISKRSKAAYPPPRCVLDHKVNGTILASAQS